MDLAQCRLKPKVDQAKSRPWVSSLKVSMMGVLAVTFMTSLWLNKETSKEGEQQESNSLYNFLVYLMVFSAGLFTIACK